eukprot:TRINITY_DN5226_c0_g1_i1.p1 TRINITY_DN5226_c0_g1~~TRINITY_DN5226_c0_g1_i1.p1  ORF type:complete len:154 (-),score=49.15 TRINITY_DN5226_c0_g1_i1:63-503(-)
MPKEAVVIGGRLKLKGAPLQTKGVASKKKTQGASKIIYAGTSGKAAVAEHTRNATLAEALGQPRHEDKAEKDAAEKEAAFATVPPDEVVPLGKTKAQLEFAVLKAKREAAMVKKLAEKTHRDKIVEFNQKLANLSEHYDIPKVGPG